MKIINGVADARRQTAMDSKTQSVTVTDGNGVVILSLSSSSYDAILDPEQAVYIAQQLTAAAARAANSQANVEAG